jgi:hypothetical protein
MNPLLACGGSVPLLSSQCHHPKCLELGLKGAGETRKIAEVGPWAIVLATPDRTPLFQH